MPDAKDKPSDLVSRLRDPDDPNGLILRRRAADKLERIAEWADSHINDPSRTNDEPAVLAARAVRAILYG